MAKWAERARIEVDPVAGGIRHVLKPVVACQRSSVGSELPKKEVIQNRGQGYGPSRQVVNVWRTRVENREPIVKPQPGFWIVQSRLLDDRYRCARRPLGRLVYAGPSKEHSRWWAMSVQISFITCPS
jgi:hypothetical protein